jgi:hypothetical protein
MDTTQTASKWLTTALIVLMAALAIGAFSFGASIYVIAVIKWTRDGYHFIGWSAIDWLAGLIGAGFIHVSVILLALVLRFIRWSKSPTASLVLAATAAAYIIFTYVMLVSPFDDEVWIGKLIMLACAVLSLIVLCLPPYLHWQRDRRPVTIDPQA